jgi:hypothetical protein
MTKAPELSTVDTTKIDDKASTQAVADQAPRVRLGDAVMPWSKTPKARLGDAVMPW